MDKNQIIGIYDHMALENQENAKYYFRYLLTSLGEVDKEFVREAYDDMYLKAPCLLTSAIGPFDDGEAVRRFAYLLCEKLSVNKFSLISVKKYNEFMEHIPPVENYLSELFAIGEIIENQQINKLGIFSNIFSSKF